MTKLTPKKIKWLVNQVVYKGKDPKEVANDVCSRRIQQLAKEYRATGVYPELINKRRPRNNLTLEQERLIEETYRKHCVGARLLKMALDEEHPGNRISKNKIHEYLQKKGITKPNKKKSRPRKRCRYERGHSGSLVHIDTHFCDWNKELYLMTVIDDASRKILAALEVKEASAENAIRVMKKAIQKAWQFRLIIKQVNSDRGPEFHPNKPGKNHKEHAFQYFLRKKGIKHIPSSVQNPQTNGKLERWHQEYEKNRPRFESIQEYIEWNNERIHGELGTKPDKAFLKKIPAECLIGLIFGGESYEKAKKY